jgi:type II secretion system (T2SS) protein M
MQMTDRPIQHHWAALLALLLGAGLWAAHTLSFAPLAAHYRRQLTAAGEIGASLDPRLAVAPLPPRVTRLFQANSISAADADRLSQSGSFATDLVRRVSEIAVANGLDVVASQPGAASHTTSTIEVRAQLRLQGRYEQVVRLLDQLAHEGAFYRLDGLSLAPLERGGVEADLQVTRMLMKRRGPAR